MGAIKKGFWGRRQKETCILGRGAAAAAAAAALRNVGFALLHARTALRSTETVYTDTSKREQRGPTATGAPHAYTAEPPSKTTLPPSAPP